MKPGFAPTADSDGANSSQKLKSANEDYLTTHYFHRQTACTIIKCKKKPRCAGCMCSFVVDQFFVIVMKRGRQNKNSIFIFIHSKQQKRKGGFVFMAMTHDAEEKSKSRNAAAVAWGLLLLEPADIAHGMYACCGLHPSLDDAGTPALGPGGAASAGGPRRLRRLVCGRRRLRVPTVLLPAERRREGDALATGLAAETLPARGGLLLDEIPLLQNAECRGNKSSGRREEILDQLRGCSCTAAVNVMGALTFNCAISPIVLHTRLKGGLSDGTAALQKQQQQQTRRRSFFILRRNWQLARGAADDRQYRCSWLLLSGDTPPTPFSAELGAILSEAGAHQHSLISAAIIAVRFCPSASRRWHAGRAASFPAALAAWA